MAKSKIIIGIHGLGNKPPKILFEEWWRLSILEGLKNIGYPRTNLNFELVYWADALHPVPLDPNEKDEGSELFLEEKYNPVTNRKTEENNSIKNSMVQYIRDQFNNILFNEKLHINFPSITDFIIKHFFKDLSVYLTENCVTEDNKDCLAKEVIQERLHQTLNKHQDKDILLISHSMGTIVAYDVLTKFSDELEIDTWITTGSPLGVPFIYSELKFELQQAEDSLAHTPDAIIRHWFNFADPNDKLAVNYELDKLFTQNIHEINSEAMLVHNDYESNGIKNPHKIYGYLRAPEISKIIDDFLCKGKSKFSIWMRKKFFSVLSKIKS